MKNLNDINKEQKDVAKRYLPYLQEVLCSCLGHSESLVTHYLSSFSFGRFDKMKYRKHDVNVTVLINPGEDLLQLPLGRSQCV